MWENNEIEVLIELFKYNKKLEWNVFFNNF